MSSPTKFVLDESKMPRHWYNIAADLPKPPHFPVLWHAPKPRHAGFLHRGIGSEAGDHHSVSNQPLIFSAISLRR